MGAKASSGNKLKETEENRKENRNRDAQDGRNGFAMGKSIDSTVEAMRDRSPRHLRGSV
jgi:hypothetical protein